MKLYPALLPLLASVGLFAAQPPPPVSPHSHDFDFWLSAWNVTTPDGKPAGISHIESIASGRGLLENWEGSPGPNGQPGGSGKSLNTYNPAKQQWQQFWVGSGGAVLELAGGLDDAGHMVLSGTGQNGAINRITWTPNPDGTVRQQWEVSQDAGKTWQTAFVGVYRKKA